MSLHVNSLSYIHPDREILFENISFSIAQGQKASLVGNNGSGKSTLMQVVAGLSMPAGGTVSAGGDIWYVPQHPGQFDNQPVAAALGIAGKLTALKAILAGKVDEAYFSTLGDDWDIEERVVAAFEYWHLQHIDLSQPMHSLSGGEKAKVFLSGIMVHSPEIILMDEPSNHLDHSGRALLYDLISNSSKTFLIISHDRMLLNLVEITFEMDPAGIVVFGGNYDFYREQKAIHLHALQAQLDEGEKAMRQSRQKARELAEQRQKQEARGSRQGQSKSLPRIVAGNLKRSAEQTTARLKDVHEERVGQAADELRSIRARIRDQTVLKIDIRKPALHAGKLLVEATDLNFSYGNKLLWKSPLDFMIRSGDRIRITGDNGSGKSTLLGLITGQLTPAFGTLLWSDFQYVFVNQEYSSIRDDLSVLGQAQFFNERKLDESEVKMLLHYHQFPREMWDLPCGVLSGGEKMKLSLCCIALQTNTPEMLILDEPTNNLDVRSQEILTEAVRGFGGTVIVISHDRHFVEAINAGTVITLR